MKENQHLLFWDKNETQRQNMLFIEGAVNDSMCQKWFDKFCAEWYSTQLSRLVEVDNTQIKTTEKIQFYMANAGDNEYRHLH